MTPPFIREGVIGETVGFPNEGGLSFLAYGILGYIGVVYFLVQSLRGSSVLMVNAAWDGISAFVESLLAFIVLGERFSDTGIGLIVAGLFFLKIPLK
jgi:multidrug transporter EmrE-like cation transporter